MILLPKLYLRNQKVAIPSGNRSVPEDPKVLIEQWAKAGAEAIHIVDLDAPVAGQLPNGGVILSCIRDHHMRVHVSGNIRTVDPMQKYAALGVEMVVLGGIAYQQPALLKEAIAKLPTKIAVTLDVKNEKVSIAGWAASPHKTAFDYYDQFATAGVASLYYSDITEAPNQINLNGIRKMAEHAKLPLYYNGEVMSPDDIASILLVEKFGVVGCVLNKALYESRLDLASSITYMKERSQTELGEETIMED